MGGKPAFARRHYRCDFICHRDWASKVLDSMTYTDFSEHAGWRKTIPPENYFWDFCDHRTSVLTLMPGWMRDLCKTDTMHCVNLGTAHLLIGNAIIFLANNRVDLHIVEPRLTPLDVNASRDDILFDLQLRFKYFLSDNKQSCSCKKFTVNSMHRENNQKFP
eukprot:9489751-Pyramimonas_sp.AAC.1